MKVHTSVRLEGELLISIEEWAKAEGISKTAFIEKALEKAVRDRDIATESKDSRGEKRQG